MQQEGAARGMRARRGDHIKHCCCGAPGVPLVRLSRRSLRSASGFGALAERKKLGNERNPGRCSVLGNGPSNPTPRSNTPRGRRRRNFSVKTAATPLVEFGERAIHARLFGAGTVALIDDDARRRGGASDERRKRRNPDDFIPIGLSLSRTPASVIQRDSAARNSRV